jgi:hypothetical protein
MLRDWVWPHHLFWDLHMALHLLVALVPFGVARAKDGRGRWSLLIGTECVPSRLAQLFRQVLLFGGLLALGPRLRFVHSKSCYKK